jgi:hypothetical protein
MGKKLRFLKAKQINLLFFSFFPLLISLHDMLNNSLGERRMKEQRRKVKKEDTVDKV